MLVNLKKSHLVVMILLSWLNYIIYLFKRNFSQIYLLNPLSDPVEKCDCFKLFFLSL